MSVTRGIKPITANLTKEIVIFNALANTWSDWVDIIDMEVTQLSMDNINIFGHIYAKYYYTVNDKFLLDIKISKIRDNAVNIIHEDYEFTKCNLEDTVSIGYVNKMIDCITTCLPKDKYKLQARMLSLKENKHIKFTTNSYLTIT